MVLARGHGAARDERIIRDHLGADEAAGDVAVDFAGGFLRHRAARNRPGAAFVFAHREERHVAQQVVAGADHAVEPGFFQPEIGEERGRVRRLERRNLELDLRADRELRPSPRARETR